MKLRGNISYDFIKNKYNVWDEKRIVLITTADTKDAAVLALKEHLESREGAEIGSQWKSPVIEGLDT